MVNKYALSTCCTIASLRSVPSLRAHHSHQSRCTDVSSHTLITLFLEGMKTDSDDDYNFGSGDEFYATDDDDTAFDAMSSDGSLDLESSPIHAKTTNDVRVIAGKHVQCLSFLRVHR